MIFLDTRENRCPRYNTGLGAVDLLYISRGQLGVDQLHQRRSRYE